MLYIGDTTIFEITDFKPVEGKSKENLKPCPHLNARRSPMCGESHR